jgi:hypothetical protein
VAQRCLSTDDETRTEPVAALYQWRSALCAHTKFAVADVQHLKELVESTMEDVDEEEGGGASGGGGDDDGSNEQRKQLLSAIDSFCRTYQTSVGISSIPNVKSNVIAVDISTGAVVEAKKNNFLSRPLSQAHITSTMKIAIEGCCHGDLDKIYATLEHANQELQLRGEEPVRLLLVCGDFEAMRDEADMQCKACPPKYRSMKDFYKYYSGEK